MAEKIYLRLLSHQPTPSAKKVHVTVSVGDKEKELDKVGMLWMRPEYWRKIYAAIEKGTDDENPEVVLLK